MLIINSICNNLYKFVSMSDIEKEIFEVEEFNEELEQPKPKNKRKLTDEQKQRNLENLKRGREKALINRRKKAELKKLEKEEKEKDIDSKLEMLKRKRANKSVELLKSPVKEYENKHEKSNPNPSSSGPNVDNKLLEQLNEFELELQTLKSNTNNQKPVNNVLEKPKQVEKHKPLQKPKEIESPKVEIKKNNIF